MSPQKRRVEGPTSPQAPGSAGGSPSEQGGGQAARWLSSLSTLPTFPVTVWKESFPGRAAASGAEPAWSGDEDPAAGPSLRQRRGRPATRRVAGALPALQPGVGPGRGRGGAPGAAHSQVIGQVVLLQGVRFEAVRHRVEVIVAYATDEAFGLEDKGNARWSRAESSAKEHGPPPGPDESSAEGWAPPRRRRGHGHRCSSQDAGAGSKQRARGSRRRGRPKATPALVCSGLRRCSSEDTPARDTAGHCLGRRAGAPGETMSDRGGGEAQGTSHGPIGREPRGVERGRWAPGPVPGT